MSRSISLFTLVIFLVIPALLLAQAQITVETPRHQYGDIQEADGMVNHTFTFKNTGNDTLKILKLKVSHPDMTARAIPEQLPAGKTGEVVVQINPANLKGKIERHISIRTNDPDFPVRQMTLSGNVIPSLKTTEDLYLHRSGNLKFMSKHIAFDQFMNNQVRTDTFRIYNAWDKAMKISIIDPPDYTLWNIIPPVLEAGKEGVIAVTYDAAKSKNWGLSMNTFVLQTNDTLEAKKMITIGVNILEDFSYYKATPDIEIPSVSFSETTFHFGKTNPGEVLKHTFNITNTGKGKLMIRKVKPSCGCTVPHLEKEELKPGESAGLTVEFTTLGYSGKQMKTITVISNDPENPVVLLSIGADLP